MLGFIVVTESYYGGLETVKLFRKRSDSDTYAESIPILNAIVIKILLQDGCDSFYVPFTEEWYGGTTLTEAFKTADEAEKHIPKINKDGSLDVIVQKLLLQ